MQKLKTNDGWGSFGPRCLQATKMVKIITTGMTKGSIKDDNKPGTISATMRAYMEGTWMEKNGGMDKEKRNKIWDNQS